MTCLHLHHRYPPTIDEPSPSPLRNYKSPPGYSSSSTGSSPVHDNSSRSKKWNANSSRKSWKSSSNSSTSTQKSSGGPRLITEKPDYKVTLISRKQTDSSGVLAPPIRYNRNVGVPPPSTVAPAVPPRGNPQQPSAQNSTYKWVFDQDDITYL